MDKNKLIYSIKKQRKFETDKYDARYHFSEDGEFYKTIWESYIDTGPGAFNLSSVDLITYNDNNDVRKVRYGDYGFRRTQRNLSEKLVKFRP